MPERALSTNPPAIIYPERLVTAVEQLNAHAARIARDLRAMMEISGHDEGFRPAIERLAQSLIDFLNDTDGDPDLEPTLAGSCPPGQLDEVEPDGDDEPSLGSFDRVINQLHAWKQRSSSGAWWDVDIEQDDCDREPSLGSLGSGWNAASFHQDAWARGGLDDREHEDLDEDSEQRFSLF